MLKPEINAKFVRHGNHNKLLNGIKQMNELVTTFIASKQYNRLLKSCPRIASPEIVKEKLEALHKFFSMEDIERIVKYNPDILLKKPESLVQSINSLQTALPEISATGILVNAPKLFSNFMLHLFII